MTRIDEVLGDEIFKSIQDKFPSNIGIMVGIEDTSGELITGERKYETCGYCRLLINPCLKDMNYNCEGNDKCPITGICTAKKGNPQCTASDQRAGLEARRTNMTVLYRCHFGLANYAIPVGIGERGSNIILYGGQFGITPLKPDRTLIEDIDPNREKLFITEGEFYRIVSLIETWRSKHKYLPNEDHIEEYMSDENVSTEDKHIQVLFGTQKKPQKWDLCTLNDYLLKRYNLSLFASWVDFLTAPKPEVYKGYYNDLFATDVAFKYRKHVEEDVLKRAGEVVNQFESTAEDFFQCSEDLSPTYKDAIITPQRALRSIELLKEIATLLAKTANVIFYKYIFFMLKDLWNNHPISFREEFDERWIICENLLKELDTSKELKDTLELVGRLTTNLMYFAYQLLYEDLSSVISVLRYNYELANEYKTGRALLENTEIAYKNILAISCVFIRELLDDECEKETKEKVTALKRLYLRNKLEKFRLLDEESAPVKKLFEELRKSFDRYILGELPELPINASFKKNDYLQKFEQKVIDFLQEESRLRKNGLLKPDNVMLTLLNIAFNVDPSSSPKEGLQLIEANLKWADTKIREQIGSVSASVVQFDVCQSLIRFLNSLKERVYADRFNVIKQIAKSDNRFVTNFMNPSDMSCAYFIDHGIKHVLKVLRNVDEIIKLVEKQGKDSNHKNICTDPIWHFYLRCAALFHDVGMFSTAIPGGIYGGPAAVRRCHGAYSARRIVTEKKFEILGTLTDRQIIAQICSFHQSSERLELIHPKCRVFAAMLRIADEFDLGKERLRTVHLPSRDKKRERYFVDLEEIVKKWKGLPHPEADWTCNEYAELKKKIVRVALNKGFQEDKIDPSWVACSDFVQMDFSRYEEGSKEYIDAVKYCSEIQAMLETDEHYRRHDAVEEVEIVTVPRGEHEYLVPLISIARLAGDQADEYGLTKKGQPRILKEVKREFKREIELLRDYLEPYGIRFKRPRIKSNRNLLFINSPVYAGRLKFIGAPTSLLYAIAPLSALIDGEGGEIEPDYMDVNIEVWDPGFLDPEKPKELEDILEDLKPKIIGMSNTSAGHCRALQIAKIAKKNAKASNWQTIIILGGSHENILCEETVNKNKGIVDISVGGREEDRYQTEAEYVLKDIVRLILERNISSEELPQIMSEIDQMNIEGRFKVAYLKNGKVSKIESKGNPIRLDSLPIMPRHLIDDESRYSYEIFGDKVTGRLLKTAQVTTTRGCIHECVFCSSVGATKRRTVDNVIEELERLKEDGYEAIFFDDSTFADECGEKRNAGGICPYMGEGERCPKTKDKKAETAGKKCGYIQKLCEKMMTKKELNFVWGCQTRADVVNEKLLDSMKNAGCVYIYLGIESMNDNVLNKMRKGITADQMRQAISMCREKGFDIGISLVFGLEGENSFTIKQTIDEVSKILTAPVRTNSKVICVSMNIATVYPGTELEKSLEDTEFKKPNFDCEPQLCGEPWSQFEDGIWNIPPCLVFDKKLKHVDLKDCSEKFAREILNTARREFGLSLV